MGACNSVNSKKNDPTEGRNYNLKNNNLKNDLKNTNSNEVSSFENRNDNNNNFNFEDLPEVKEFLENKNVETYSPNNTIKSLKDKSIVNQSTNKEATSKSILPVQYLESKINKPIAGGNILPVQYLEAKINNPIVDDNIKVLPTIYLNNEETKNFNIDEILKRSQAYKK